MNWGHFLFRFAPQDFQVDVLSHSSDDLLNTCRICRDETVRESLVSPCYCSGTLAKCHVPCLEEWLSKANKSTCEICGYKYLTTRIPKSFNEVSPNERKQSASVKDILEQFRQHHVIWIWQSAIIFALWLFKHQSPGQFKGRRLLPNMDKSLSIGSRHYKNSEKGERCVTSRKAAAKETIPKPTE